MLLLQVLRSRMPPKTAGRGGRGAPAKRGRRGGSFGRSASVGGGAYAAPRRFSKIRKAPSSGMRPNYGKKLMRPTVAKIERPFVKRNVRESHFTYTAVPNPNVPGTNMLTPLNIRVPDLVWGQYTQGFDVSQITSLLLKSRNVMCNMRITMPKQTQAPQPYQFRIVQGFVKSCITGAQMASTAGTSGLQDGIHFAFNTATAYDNYVNQVVQDSIGVQAGDPDFTGPIDARRVHVVEDEMMTVSPESTDTQGNMIYRTRQKVINWKTNTKMRLYASTQNMGPAVPNIGDIAWTPLNNPSLWTPFIAVILQNNQDYTVDADGPRIDYTWTHYWTDC